MRRYCFKPSQLRVRKESFCSQARVPPDLDDRVLTLITKTSVLNSVFDKEYRELWDDGAFCLLAVAADESQVWVSAARAMPPTAQ